MASGDVLTIGEAAARTGLSVPTIRYYEEIGLVRQVGRRDGGHRFFADESVRRLEFVARCRDLGFTIAQVRQLLAVTLDDGPCAQARSVGERHLRAVDAKIAELSEIRRHLADFVRRCAASCADASAASCAPLAGLAARRKTAKRRRVV